MARIVTRGFSYQKTRTGQEPVLINQVKEYLQLDFEEHDSLLNLLIKSAINTVEKFCGVSIVPSTIRVRWESLGTAEELPYGPVRDITDQPDSVTIAGLIPGFPRVSGMTRQPVEVEYETGYDEIPEDLKLSIIKLVTDNFEKRTGFDMAGRLSLQVMPNNWKDTARRHRRISWLG